MRRSVVFAFFVIVVLAFLADSKLRQLRAERLGVAGLWFFNWIVAYYPTSGSEVSCQTHWQATLAHSRQQAKTQDSGSAIDIDVDVDDSSNIIWDQRIESKAPSMIPLRRGVRHVNIL